MSKPSSTINHKKNQRNFLNRSLISKYLICPICQDVFYDPIRLTCGHTFCNDCFKKWDKVSNGTCPMCREAYEEAFTSRDLVAFNIINELNVICVNKSCPWKGILSDLDNHMKTCLFDKKKMPSYVKKIINETSKNEEKRTENEEEDENVDNENVEFNVNASLKARLYQKHPELMINVFKTKEELEKEEKKEMKKEPPKEDLNSLINEILGVDDSKKDTKKMLKRKRKNH